MTAPVDQADRDRARLGLDVNAVVEAGAGTGKTTLLTDRLLFQLLAGESAAPVTRLVALTFTEKAAAEIKVRLAEKLAKVLMGGSADLIKEIAARFGADESKAKQLARRALEDLDKSQIGTIHSFAAHVLRLFPVEAGVDPAFTVDEGSFFDELFDAEWAAFLDGELGEKPPRERAWLEVLRLAPLEDLRALARELCREKLELSAVGGPDPEAAAALESLAAELERIKETQPPPHARSKIDVNIKETCARLRSLAAAARSELPPLPGKLAHEKLSTSTWPKNWDPALEEVYERAVAAASVSSAAREALVRRACALVLPFARRFRKLYTRRGFVSFDGLLRKARDLVRDHTAVREELKRQYAALFIDEFQDTDPLQGEFLLLLAEAPGRCARDWESARLGAGRLFVVGDPKQSIYRFRGADIAAYQRFTARILGEGASCDLKANFRSPAGLIGPVNAVFEGVMVHRPGLQAPYKALAAGGAAAADNSPAVELARVRGASDAASVRGAEARFIASWIAANCGEGKAWKFKDVAVLARTTRPFPELLSALRAAGVPYAVETEKGFYGSPEVLDLVNLLRALDDPSDRAAIAGLLRSPLALLPDGELYELAKAHKLDYSRTTGIARVDALYARLAALRERVGRVPLGELAAAAAAETNLLELSAKAYYGAQTVANLGKFLRLAAEASDERGLTLKEYVGELLEGLKEGEGEGESPLADEHLDAVRLLTIHKSKGLEFPVVFLTNASGKASGGGKKSASCVDWGTGRVGLRLESSGAASAGMASLEPQEKERQRHEALRLLYVALTRAKKRLIVVGSEKGDGSALTSLMAMAGAWPAPDFSGDSVTVGIWPLPLVDVPSDAPAAAAPAAEKGKKPAVDERALASRWKARVAARDEVSAGRWSVSPTALMREGEKERPLEEGRGSPVGALVGQLCHRVLEGVDFERPPKGAALEAAVARAGSGLELGSGAAEALSQAAKTLAGFFESADFKDLSGLQVVGREVPFVFARGGAVVRGAIDLLARDAKGGLVVADYKSAKADAERYEPQKRLYLEAVSAATGSAASFRLVFLTGSASNSGS